MIAKPELITAEELLVMPDDDLRHELVRDVLFSYPLRGDREGVSVARTGFLLGNSSYDSDMGSVTVSSGYLLEREPDTVCCPAVAWVASGRVEGRVRGFAKLAPDLVVEVRSPSDSRRHMSERATMWLSHGVRMVLAADPQPPVTLTVYRSGEPPLILSEFDVFDGGDVLPGFSEPVWRFFRRHR